MKPTVIVFGPKGCGKTRNAERLRAHFGLDLVIDDWRPGRDGNRVPSHGALVLTSVAVPDPHFEPGVRWCAFDAAMGAIQGTASNERRERIATAVLAGIFAGNVYDPSRRSTPRSMASNALEAADALIVELDK